jgi:hypothetical protein
MNPATPPAVPPPQPPANGTPVASGQPLPSAGYPGVHVAQAAPQGVVGAAPTYTVPTQGYAPPPALYPQPAYPQPAGQPYFAQGAQAAPVPTPIPTQVAPQGQTAPPAALDAATAAAPPELRALLRPGESMMTFTELNLTRKFWHVAERKGTAIRGYLVGLEWYVADGMRLLFFQFKPMYPIDVTLDDRVPATAHPGEVVLIPVTAELLPLRQLLEKANAHVPDLMISALDHGRVKVRLYNFMVPRSIADAR